MFLIRAVVWASFSCIEFLLRAGYVRAGFLLAIGPGVRDFCTVGDLVRCSDGVAYVVYF